MASPLLRNLPSVNELLEQTQIKGLIDTVSQSVVASRVRQILDEVRVEVQTAASERTLPNVAELAERIVRTIADDQNSPVRSVINATGILLPAGPGGVPLAESAVSELMTASRDYVGAALDSEHAVEALLREQTGAEAALLTNSRASGLMLALAALSAGRETLVSRGEISEAADGSRLTDLISASGAKLREVGSANRTHLADYQQAIGEESAAMLRVHSPEFRIVGSTAQPSLADMARLAHERGLTLIDDIGLGGVLDFSSFGLTEERHARASLEAGADVVLFAGEKLLGGPACGILVGRRRTIEAIARHPLARALACDTPTQAALAATLRIYREPDRARREIPLLHFLSTSIENLRNRAERLAPQLAASAAIEAAEALADVTGLTENAVPAQQLPTWCVALMPKRDWPVSRLTAALRAGCPSVVGRVRGERLLLDLRSVFTRQDQALVAALAGVGRPKS